MSAQNSTQSGGVWLLVLFGLVLMIIGLPLLYGGVQLIGLGGSWYYALAGAGIIVSGFLFALRRRAGLWLYILIFLATIVWALWEAGLNVWPLVPRLVAPAVIAVVALLLAPLFPASRGRRAPFAAAGLLVLGLIATAAYAFQPHGVIRNAVAAEAPAPAVPSAAASATDWRHYGRTPAGTRYAPIDQITKDNVKGLEVAWTFRTGDIPEKGAEDQNTP
ncbi:MAG: membrane-bound PQQ-dependent dehydrogenase, glucose/quinate/shikimate family, partial [Mesorhizobium sp.]|nr:membrane-bound PQQ-dependent dehydrogenase, glucose/quinate/shikimate family [Mesorhizobium sp.]